VLDLKKKGAVPRLRHAPLGNRVKAEGLIRASGGTRSVKLGDDSVDNSNSLRNQYGYVTLVVTALYALCPSTEERHGQKPL
jgi:hypothetical protein